MNYDLAIGNDELKVHFDGQIFIDQVTGGVSRYYTNLAMGLNDITNVKARIIAPIHRNEHLSSEKQAPVLGVGVPSSWRAGRICWAMQKTLAPLISQVGSPDIVHETYFSPKSYLPSAKRRVITVFDMIHELYFPGSQTSEYKREALLRSDHVICISHNTRNDLCEMFDFPREKTSVTYLSYQNFGGYGNSNLLPKLEGRPYFLYVGNRGGYKNFDTLLRAFASSARLSSEFRLVCFGGGSFLPEELEIAATLGVSSEQLIQIGGDDEALGVAYANALAFVYPSLYEGFGIPPLEAMSASCPVVCSNSSSLPEVVGDAALVFEPSSVEKLQVALENIADSQDLRSSLVLRGHTQRNKFSWQQCAKDTLAVYKSIL